MGITASASGKAGALPYNAHNPLAVFFYYWPDWLSAIALTASAITFDNVYEPNRSRHFDPADPAFGYPMLENTVSVPMLIVLSVAMPGALAIALNVVLALFRPGWGWALDLHNYGLGIFQATAVSQLGVVVLKATIGRLRPSALARLAADPDDPEALLAFPSGHATMAFSGMVYFALYLSGKCGTFRSSGLTLRKNKADAFAGSFTVAVFTVVLPLSLALYIFTTRLTDYVHDFADVTAGAILGSVSSIITYHLNFPGLAHVHCDLARPLAHLQHLDEVEAAGPASRLSRNLASTSPSA